VRERWREEVNERERENEGERKRDRNKKRAKTIPECRKIKGQSLSVQNYSHIIFKMSAERPATGAWEREREREKERKGGRKRGRERAKEC